MKKVFFGSRVRTLCTIAIVIGFGLLCPWVSATFAQPFGQRGHGKAVTFESHWFMEEQLFNLPAKKALYLFILYEDGYVERKRAPG